MKVYKAIKKRRSIRKFRQKRIKLNVLNELLNAARLAPSAANIQPLKYVIVINSADCLDKVFSALKWAAYISPEGNPKKDERPTAYIIVLVDKNKEKFPAERDIGAAVENILLLATSKGLAGCWLGAVDKEKLSNVLKLPSNYRIDSVIALGYPKEKSFVADWKGNVEYFKDEKGNLHVPKRNIKDIILQVK